MEDKKRYCLTFRADRWKGKRIYITCAAWELQGEKERWAMILEKETGLSWRCEDVSEAGPSVGASPGKED